MIFPSFKNNFKGEIPYSDYLTPEQVILLERSSNTVKFNAKDNIFKQNTRTSHIMFVKSGLVKIFGSTANFVERFNFGEWTLLKISSICC